MRLSEITSGLSAFAGRGAGTDAERRAGLWLADRLRQTGREVIVEPFWCRPNTAMTHAWHAVLGLAGSLVAVHSPRVGAALLLVAALSVIVDALFGVSLGRRLTPECASQNIVALPPKGARRGRVALVLTANYDAGRMGYVDRDTFRRPTARLRSGTGGFTFGWLGWIELALIALLATAIGRYEGASGTLIGLAQLIPTIVLVVAAASLTERAGAPPGPAAGDNATGVAAIFALARSLDAEPLTEATVHVVLTGAGDGPGIGLRMYLRARRRSLRSHNTVVIGVGPCTAGTPRYWHSDGPFVPVRYFGTLRRLSREAGEEQPELRLQSYRGRGSAAALAARMAGIPAISIGSLDELGISPRSHQPTDTADAVELAALQRTVEVGLLLADGVDCFLADFAPVVEASEQRARSTLGERLGRVADWAGRPTVRRTRSRHRTS
jgi:hypothetical protein